MTVKTFGSLREKIGAESAARKADYTLFALVLVEAFAAGVAAATKTTPVPMVVQLHTNALDDSSPVQKEWIVDDGVCGFGWVRVVPGTSRFAKFLVKTGVGSRAYNGGVTIWSSLQTQSLERNATWANEVARVLTERLGVKAYGESRID